MLIIQEVESGIVRLCATHGPTQLDTLSPGQTDSQVDASQRKFAKPELAYGLAKGGQTDSQVGLQVAKKP